MGLALLVRLEFAAGAIAGFLPIVPVNAGSFANAGLLESLAQLWGKLAYEQKLGRTIAFKLLPR